MNLCDSLKNVFKRLQDDLSRDIFLCRLSYFLTGNAKHYVRMIVQMDEYEQHTEPMYKESIPSFSQLLTAAAQVNPRTIIVYGAGGVGDSIMHLLKSMHSESIVQCYCDGNTKKQGELFHGVSVLSPEQAVQLFPQHKFLIATSIFGDEMVSNLLKMGIDKNRIYRTSNLAMEYFGLPFLPPIKDEIYLDCGGYNGDTALKFAQWCKDYRKIYVMEPDIDSFAKLQSAISGLKNTRAVQMGAWSHEAALNFDGRGAGESRISGDGRSKIEVAPIDSIVGSESVTFIKMDVEGAELEALKGARGTITKNRPRLAICIYHKPEDVVEIPLYLLELVPDYKFYIRHHSQHMNSTVLYAV